MIEAVVEDHFVKVCAEEDVFCPKTVWLGRKGCPDREATWPWGDIDKVELKRSKGGRYEPGQERAHREYAKRGIPVYLLNTKEKIDKWRAARKARRHLPELWSVPVTRDWVYDCKCTNMDCPKCYPDLNG